MSSILNDVKRAVIGDLDIDGYMHFDHDLIMHINSTLNIVKQLGIGPTKNYEITGDKEQWTDFFQEDENFPMIKSYIYLKVRLLFDPPQNSSLIEAMKNQIAEFEWRLNVDAETSDW